MVRVHHDEGIANRIDPESRAAAREGSSESLTGERTGLAIESRKYPHSGCRRRSVDGRQYEWTRYRERPVGPAWSKTLACVDALCVREPGALTVGQQQQVCVLSGPYREGEEP